MRRITAVLLFLAGTASIALPFISATALTLSIGVIAAVFAGPLARILTFDSEPQEKARDLTDTLLSGKS